MAKNKVKEIENINDNPPIIVEEKPNKSKKKKVVLEPETPILTIDESVIPQNKKAKTSKKTKLEEPAPVVEVVPEEPKVEAKPKKTKKVKAIKEEPAPVVEVVPEEPKVEEEKIIEIPSVDTKKKEIPEDQKPYTGTVRYSDEDLSYFESIILRAKKDTMEELRMLRERLEDLNSYDLAEESMIYSMHMGEQGSEPAEKEKTYAQIQRINEYLLKLDDALQRIKDKTYGICQKCNILIARERLEAVPITTQSASWKIHGKCPEDGIDRITPIK